ncbi:MAG: GNAT family N-acetyltransferase [Bacteroidota bacterium]
MASFFRIRTATPDDAPALIVLIEALAAYEKLSHEAQPDEAALRQHLAPDAQPRCEAFLAERVDTGQAIGLALFFQTYSTFLTRWGIYLEDLFVVPEHRGRGVGMALLRRLAAEAVARRCERLEWQVLDWNELALGFYDRLGARPLDDWITMRLSGDALHRLGAPVDPSTPSVPPMA